MAGFQENSHICRNTKLHIGYHVNSDTSPNTMVFNATFKNISVISWQSVLLVDGTGDYQFIE
jgi:hypothetical protein